MPTKLCKGCVLEGLQGRARSYTALSYGSFSEIEPSTNVQMGSISQNEPYEKAAYDCAQPYAKPHNNYYCIYTSSRKMN